MSAASMLEESKDRIRIGISSCLLGEKVRYDANHKLDAYISGTLSQFFEFVPACPEVAIGMGVPRPPIRLVGNPERPRACGVRDASLDVTEALTAYGRRMALELEGISGYIFKSKSPSCGVARVKVYGGGAPSSRGVGIYAREVMARNPLLPVEEEARLGNAVLRENFIERVYAYHRWLTVCAQGITPAKLVAFHTDHKLILMAHGPVYYRALGRLVADAGARANRALYEDYAVGFMDALKHLATRKRHTNVLMHLMGYLKKQLDAEDKAELLEVFEAYRTGLVPRIVPLTLLQHHFRRHPTPYVARQLYLHPHPRELMLLNGT